MRTRGVVAFAIAVLGSGSSAADPTPREHYLLHCSGCHGSDARGAPGVTPSLHDLAPVFQAPGGRAYLAAVPGVAQAPVDDADLAALMNWLIAEFSRSPASPPYTPEEMHRLRADPLRDPEAARERVLSGS